MLLANLERLLSEDPHGHCVERLLFDFVGLAMGFQLKSLKSHWQRPGTFLGYPLLDVMIIIKVGLVHGRSLGNHF